MKRIVFYDLIENLKWREKASKMTRLQRLLKPGVIFLAGYF
jgi:hypothetical protein